MSVQMFREEMLHRLRLRYGAPPWELALHIYEYPNGFAATYQPSFKPGVSYTYNTETPFMAGTSV